MIVNGSVLSQTSAKQSLMLVGSHNLNSIITAESALPIWQIIHSQRAVYRKLQPVMCRLVMNFGSVLADCMRRLQLTGHVADYKGDGQWIL